MEMSDGIPSKGLTGRKIPFSVRLLTKPDGYRAFATTWLLKEATKIQD